MIYESQQFFTCIQKSGGTIDYCAIKFKCKRKTCEFGEHTDPVIKRQDCLRNYNHSLKEQLLRNVVLGLMEATERTQ